MFHIKVLLKCCTWVAKVMSESNITICSPTGYFFFHPIYLIYTLMKFKISLYHFFILLLSYVNGIDTRQSRLI